MAATVSQLAPAGSWGHTLDAAIDAGWVLQGDGTRDGSDPERFSHFNGHFGAPVFQREDGCRLVVDLVDYWTLEENLKPGGDLLDPANRVEFVTVYELDERVLCGRGAGIAAALAWVRP